MMCKQAVLLATKEEGALLRVLDEGDIQKIVTGRLDEKLWARWAREYVGIARGDPWVGYHFDDLVTGS